MLQPRTSLPAALHATAPATVPLVSGQPSTVTFGVENTGETAATGVVALVNLPAGTFFDGAAPGSPYTCTPPPGSNGVARCHIGTLLPSQRIDVAVRIHANGNANGRTITFSAQGDGGLSATATPTTITVADAVCAAPWEPGRPYAAGDVVSYGGWNYRAKAPIGSLWNWFAPGTDHPLWARVATCAAA